MLELVLALLVGAVVLGSRAKETVVRAASKLSLPPGGPVRQFLPNRPQAVLTSGFGKRQSYQRPGTTVLHDAVDLAVPVGTPLLAPQEGRVIASRFGKTAGNMVQIANKMYTWTFMHLDSRAVEVGQTVKPGQLLGRTGNTGASSGPHVHVEVRNMSVGQNVDMVRVFAAAGVQPWWRTRNRVSGSHEVHCCGDVLTDLEDDIGLDAVDDLMNALEPEVDGLDTGDIQDSTDALLDRLDRLDPSVLEAAFADLPDLEPVADLDFENFDQEFGGFNLFGAEAIAAWPPASTAAGWAAFDREFATGRWGEVWYGFSQDQLKQNRPGPTPAMLARAKAARTIVDVFRAAGFPPAMAIAALANAERESSLNPAAHNPTDRGGDSAGLFQLRVPGAGTGMSLAQRLDPAANTRRIIVEVNKARPIFEKAYQEGATPAVLAALFGYHVEKHAGISWRAGQVVVSPQAELEGLRRAELARKRFPELADLPAEEVDRGVEPNDALLSGTDGFVDFESDTFLDDAQDLGADAELDDTDAELDDTDDTDDTDDQEDNQEEDVGLDDGPDDDDNFDALADDFDLDSEAP